MASDRRYFFSVGNGCCTQIQPVAVERKEPPQKRIYDPFSSAYPPVTDEFHSTDYDCTDVNNWSAR